MSGALKIAGVCGFAAPIVALTFILAAIASWPQFSWVNNALSDLGVQSGATAWLFNSGLVVSGVLFAVFAAGLFRLVGKRAVGRVGAAILFLACVALILIGVFNENFRPTHYYVSVAFFVLMPISLLVLTVGFWLEGQRRLSALTLVVAVVAAAVWILQFLFNYVANVAVPEFVSGFAAALWTEAVSYRMLKEASHGTND